MSQRAWLWLAIAATALMALEEAAAKMLVQADYAVSMAAGASRAELTVRAPQAGRATVLVQGLSRGGAVAVTVNGAQPVAVELLASGGLAQGKADGALVTAELKAGDNRVAVEESEGAQIVHVPGTALWFGTTTEAAGHAVFSLDLAELQKDDHEYPVKVYYGPNWEPLCWFSGKCDKYYGESYASGLGEVGGSSGSDEATLAYHLSHAARNLDLPTSLTLVRDAGGECPSLRVRQVIKATGAPSWGDNLEFLHLVINTEYGRDWEDGVPDYVWYRAQREDAPDTLPGSHTTMVRMDDNSRRGYPYPSSEAPGVAPAQASAHHTGAAVSMEARNTIAGWFTKSGVGCVGLTFLRYQSSFRPDLRPLHSHCGDGADTHHLLFWGGLFNPLGMKQGDEVEIEYSLTPVPTEPLREDVEDLNEADLYYFGKEAEQQSTLTGWTGTKQALGLTRSDGSLILLGVGREPGRVRVPETTQRAAKRAWRMYDLGRPRYEELRIEQGTVEVRPGWLTVVDCGSALHGPGKDG